MKIIFETLGELFSDFAEDYIFGIGMFESAPTAYTYVPKTKQVLDSIGVCIDTCENTEEFKEKYKGKRICVWNN